MCNVSRNSLKPNYGMTFGSSSPRFPNETTWEDLIRWRRWVISEMIICAKNKPKCWLLVLAL